MTETWLGGPEPRRTVLVMPSQMTDGLVDLGQMERLGLAVIERRDLNSVGAEDDLIAALRGVWAVIAGNESYSRRVVESATDLRVIARPGVGYDGVDVPAATEHGVLVFTTPGVNNEAVADFTLALTLGLLSRLVSLDHAVRSGVWQPPGYNRQLQGSTVGIVGLGSVGRSVARRLRGFDCRLLAVEPQPDLKFAQELGITLMSLPEMLPQLDVLILTSALTPETRHLLGRAEIAMLRPSAIVVNTSRGAIIDQPALVDALRSGAIGGAALDVFEDEPLDPADPLTGSPNTLLSGHLASRTLAAAIGLMEAAIQGVMDIAKGDPPRKCRILNPEVSIPVGAGQNATVR